MKAKTKTGLLVLLVTLSAMALVPPAEADMDITVEFLHAPDGADPRQWTPQPDSIMTGTWKVVAEARATSNLRSFKVAIEAEGESGMGSGAEVVRTYSPTEKSSDRIELPWDTVQLTPYNGVYRLVAYGESQVGGNQSASVTELKINNPPHPPTNVTAEIISGVPTVAWKAPPEPDVTGYRVFRSEEEQPFSRVGKVAGTSFEDSEAPSGVELRYLLVSVRSSPVSSSGVSSAATLPTPAIMVVPPERVGGSMLDEPRPLEAAPQAVARLVLGQRRDLGFEPYLPYDEGEETLAIATEEAQDSGPPDIEFTAIEEAVEGTAYKPIFAASGLILLVGALHLLRFALMLLKVPVRL